jgi:hypothetical protein
MSLKVALEKTWGALGATATEQSFIVKFLSDEYDVDLNGRRVLSRSCNAQAPDYIALIILHYLIQKIKGLPAVTNEWISFQDLSGGPGYYGAFKKRVLEPLARKYGDNPSAILSCLEKVPGKRTQHGDGGVVIEAFENVPILIAVYGKDEEFSAEANVHFDKSIEQIFCTEDVAVLADIVAKLI